MAAVGDVIIKLAADYAQFVDGMKAGQDALGKFGDEAAKLNSKIDSAFAFLKGAGITAAVTAVVNEVRKLAEASERTSLEIGKQAAALGITAEQFQAYQQVAKQSGTTVEDVTKQLKNNGAETERLIRYYRDLGTVIDTETIAKFERMNAAAEESQRRIDAIIAPLYASAKATVLDAVADGLERVKQVITSFDITKAETIMKLMLLAVNPAAGALAFGVIPNVGATPAAKRIEELNDEIATTVTRLGALRSGAAQPMPMIGRDQEVGMLDKKLDQLQAERRALTQPVPTLPPLTVAATRDTPTGGGGAKTASEDDSIEAQIRRYQSLARVAEATFKTISAGSADNFENLQREAAVQQHVADIVEKFAAKKITIDDDQRKRLTEAVRLNEQQRSDNERLLADNQRAIDIEKQLGDGTLAYAEAVEKLNRAKATGRLSEEAYRRELERTRQSTENAAREAQKYSNDLDAAGAGFLDAMDKWADAHNAFNSGTAAFGAMMGAIDQAFDSLSGKSSKTFGQIAADFATMLQKIAFQMAVSYAFKFLLSLLGPSVGASTSNVSGFPVGGGPQGPSGGATARAGGGDVYPGNIYRVGEYGPETFVPNAVGRIEPYRTGGNGGGNVTVNLDMKQAEGARDPQSALEFGRRVKVAVQGVIAAEKRPGGTLYTPATGAVR